jgi:hypothetical protein
MFVPILLIRDLPMTFLERVLEVIAPSISLVDQNLNLVFFIRSGYHENKNKHPRYAPFLISLFLFMC